MIIAISAALALLAAEPDQTPQNTVVEPAAVAEPAKIDAEAKPEGMVCKNEQVLGTRFPKRVCRSKASIAQRRRTDQDTVSNIQLQGATFPRGGN